MASSVRTALYGALTGDATITGLLAPATRDFPAAVYHQVAPLAAPFPYVIFAKHDPERPTWAFAGERTDRALWLVKAVCEGPSATPAEDAADEIDRVLHDATLTLTEGRLLYLRRDSGVDYLEQSGADLFHHVGGIFRVVTEGA